MEEIMRGIVVGGGGGVSTFRLEDDIQVFKNVGERVHHDTVLLSTNKNKILSRWNEYERMSAT